MQRVVSSILHHKQFDGLDVGKGLIRFDIRPGGDGEPLLEKNVDKMWRWPMRCGTFGIGAVFED
jgi:hypothetical protein